MKFEFGIFVVLYVVSIFAGNNVITGSLLICSVICLATDRLLEKL